MQITSLARLIAATNSNHKPNPVAGEASTIHAIRLVLHCNEATTNAIL